MSTGNPNPNSISNKMDDRVKKLDLNSIKAANSEVGLQIQGTYHRNENSYNFNSNNIDIQNSDKQVNVYKNIYD